MGTRCLTVFKSRDNVQGKIVEREIAVLYRQMDGYPESHGQELANFLSAKRIINGIGQGDNKSNAFNGMECLAASVVAYFKDDIGNFYLYPAGTRNVGEEFIYEVTPGTVDPHTVAGKERQPHIQCGKYLAPADLWDWKHCEEANHETE